MRQPTDKRQKELVVGLAGLLADSYVLYNTTQGCHWNVEGPQFHSLHHLFEKQYRELAEAIDVIAERIRALGFYAPGRLETLSRLSRIRQPEQLRDAQAMLEHLIEGHGQIVHRANQLRGLAEDALDEATADLLVERLRTHETALWMLQSQAGRESVELSAVRELAHAG